MLVNANVCSWLSMHARHSARHLTLSSLNSNNNLMRLVLLFPLLADEDAEAQKDETYLPSHRPKSSKAKI